jgi:tetratricopeptide (TPR) repeat protein
VTHVTSWRHQRIDYQEVTMRPFVGRERELLTLRLAAEAALAGRGHLILLGGGAGIGKTRLAEELATGMVARGAEAVWGRCHEGDGAPALWPWIQIIDLLVRRLGPDSIGAALGAAALEVTRVLPQSSGAHVMQVPPAVNDHSSRFWLFEGITRLLGEASGRRPLVLVLDDLHVAEASSLLLLEFVARRLPDLPCLVVATYRDIPVREDHPLAHAVGELARVPTSERLLLRGLDEAAVAQFIEASEGIRPAPKIATAIHRVTEGNPLYLAEYVRLLAADGKLQASDLERGQIPASVRHIIGRRLAPLSAACRTILSVGAVAGRDFDVDVVAAASGADATAVGAAVTEARAAGVVLDGAGKAGAVRFTHVLIRDVLEAQLGQGERARVHGAVGEALERLQADDLDGHLARLAHHFAEAGPMGRERALVYTCRAADHAMRLLAYEEAARLYRSALALMDGEGRDRERCDLLIGLGEAQARAGDHAGARETLRAAGESAGARGAAEQLARAALGFGWMQRQMTVDTRRVRLLEEAASALGEVETPLAARVLGHLALALRWAPDSRKRVEELSLRAVAIARRSGDARARAHALHCRRSVLWRHDNVREAVDLATEILQLAEATGDLELTLEARRWRVVDFLTLGDIHAADTEIAAHDRIAQATHLPVALWYSKQWASMRALLAGRFAEAQACFTEAQAAAQRAHLHYPAGCVDFPLLLEQGRLSEFIPIGRALVVQIPLLAMSFRCALAWAYAEVGLREEARRELIAIYENGLDKLPQQSSFDSAATAVAEAIAYLGDAEGAECLYPLLLPFRDLCVVTVGAEHSFGAAARSLGLLAATMHRCDEAARHFDDALRTNRHLGARPWLARTQLNYASMLAARDRPGDRARATALLDEAIALAGELGMPVVLARASTLRGVLRQRSAAGAGAGPSIAVTRILRPASDAAEIRVARPAAGATLRCEGDYWTLVYAGVTGRLKDMRGLHYLVRLLDQPGQEFHVLDLLRQTTSAADAAEVRGAVRAPAFPVLDSATKVSYRRRLMELREDLAEAERHHDAGRAEHAREEIEVLTQQLAAAVGLGGRDRLSGSAAERARTTVTHRLRAVIQRIARPHPGLGDHLAARVRTGTFCTYRPDPERAIHWTLDG